MSNPAYPGVRSVLTQVGRNVRSAAGSQLKSVLRGVAAALPALALIALTTLVARHLFGAPGQSTSADPSPPVALQPFDGPTLKGDSTASVGIIEYSEFQCPFCARFVETVLPQLEEAYVKPGKMALVFRHFPLEQIHPFAVEAARVAVCSAEQGRFWDLHDRLFATQALLDTSQPMRLATELNLNNPQLQQCLAETATTRLRADIDHAKSLGLSSTPSFLVGQLAEGRLRVVSVIVGAKPFEEFAAVIDRLLRSRP